MPGYEPFAYRVTKSGEVHISRVGRLVTVVRGPAAERLIARLGDDGASDQAALQRATGNYKRGNER
ncbi:hypothetical protein PU630_15205 [Microbacterium horticulturae]|uniref:Uncharacterized protein n=1 Tax=Microbacterium horticulturae TaxID=3028316 RepID=A0ABY8BWL5_9MICO|nr:hypothetical protein [Microbacterium sp. KACC 23027]WEG08573.1 hypothetical protein PU630_15205 [Microbacterium sp. KACC 23027]